MSGRLLDLVRAEVARLHRHSLVCSGCTHCEAQRAFWALVVAVDFHVGGHLCPADPAQPTGVLLYGPGLPHGPDCPALVALARELNLIDPQHRRVDEDVV